MKIIKTDINNIDLNQDTKGLQGIWRSYLLADAGQEHYKLLAYMAHHFSGATLIELGTFKGVGTVALASNPTNKIITYDIMDQRLFDPTSNIEFRLGNIFDRKEERQLIDTPLIFLDTAHDGVFEARVYQYLCDNHYQGLLLLDDITLNDRMRHFWNSIREQKYDLTDVGHGAKSRFGTIPGTGVVDFGNNLMVQN